MLSEWFEIIDSFIIKWMDRYGFLLLRIGMAVIFIWFGTLKLLDLSPESELIRKTVYWVPPDLFMPFLGFWEIAIGVTLIFHPLVRISILLLFLLLPGTLLPFFIHPETCFNSTPLQPTLEGQYILKNLVLVGAAFVIGSRARQQHIKNHDHHPK